MPRDETVRKWIVDHPELVFEPGTRTIFCTKCQIHVQVKKSGVDRHIGSTTHRTGTNNPTEETEKEFYFDLIRMLVLCNIPWSQINNPTFKEFFNKYCCRRCCCVCDTRTLPDESLLRKKYLDTFYKNKLLSIYENTRHQKLWISLDETTDFLGRNIVHFLIRPLSANVAKKSYLTACKVLEKVNGTTISQFVIDCLESLWEEPQVQNVLLLCTDGAAYMLSAGRMLKNYLPNMKHVTCLAHALHRLSEKIRTDYKNVDSLISNTKKVFLKAPYRVRMLKQMYPNMPLPPQPVITRWGTWLEAAAYYLKYFNEIKNIVSHLRTSDSAAIKNTKDILNNENLLNDLLFIDKYYSMIPFAIKELQKKEISLSDAILVLDQVRVILNEEVPETVQKKLEQVLDRNPDLDVIREYSELLNSDSDHNETLKYYRFAPITSSDVERSFSSFKWILDVKRNRLTVENIEKIIIIYFNNFGSESRRDIESPPRFDLNDENEHSMSEEMVVA